MSFLFIVFECYLLVLFVIDLCYLLMLLSD